MPGLLSTCKQHFDTEDLYKVLGVTSTAKENELRKAYYRVSLKVHPDRVKTSERHEATIKFQTLGQVYQLLSDSDKRAIYDESGEVDEENDLSENRDWNDYWRLLFKKISVNDIKNFEEKYRESEEEMQDLKEAYLDSEGDMESILSKVLCCTIDDEPRYTEIIQEWIEKREVPSFTKFTKETSQKMQKRKRKAKQEEKEAEEMKKEFGLGDTEQSLHQLILKRTATRAEQGNAFLDSLEAKYATKEKKGKGKKK